MKLLFTKTFGGVLHPADEATEERLRKVKNDNLLIAEIKFNRNPKFHRLAFAFLNTVLQNQDKYTNLEDLLVEFKLKSGYYQEHLSMKRGLVYIPKSIAFEELEQLEFEELFSKWIDIAMRDFQIEYETIKSFI